MKITIQFDLPKEQSDLDMHMMADGMYSALWEFSQELRKYRKYDEKLTDEQHEFAIKLEEEFYNILKNQFVDLDKIP